MNIDRAQIRALAAEIAEMAAEDDRAFWDTLDGEADVIDFLSNVVSRICDDGALVSAIKAEQNALTSRRSRIEARIEKMREIVADLLDDIGRKSVQLPRATVSLRQGASSVQIEDETMIPTQLCVVKTIKTPDKTAIKAQIEAGADVPGAKLVVGPKSITVRAS